MTATVTLHPVVDAVALSSGSPETPIVLAVQEVFRGPAGLSAYELAVQGGFAGTEAQWLASLGGTGSSPSSILSTAISDASAAGRALLTAATIALQKGLLAIGSADVVDATAFGRSLLTAANAVTAKTLLAFVSTDIGDATAFGRSLLKAGNAAAAKTLLAVAASDITDATVAGRALLTAATVVAQQTALGAGLASGLAQLDSTGKVPTSQLPSSILGDVQYQAKWNAATNTPAIPAASAANRGQYYVVGNAGATAIDGHSAWNIGDWLVSNGTTWDYIDNTDLVTSVAGKVGAVLLQAADLTDSTAAGRAILTAASNAAIKTLLQITATDVSGLGTAATQNTGTSGATVPLLNGANTWSGAQTFSVVISGLQASFSGWLRVASDYITLGYMSGIGLRASYGIIWTSGTTATSGGDTFLGRNGAARIRQGDVDSAAPVAQSLEVQNVAAGTTDGAGARRTIAGSRGTGKGNGGDLALQVAPAGAATGTAQNALVDALVANGADGSVDFIAGETTIASAATVDIGSLKNRRAAITGTTAITSFGTVANRERTVRFTGSLVLTYNATSLILPGAANITTRAGDVGRFGSDASGNWRCLFYQRGDQAV